MLWDRTYSFLSLYEKTRKSNHLQMSLQRLHFLLSYLKILRVDPAGLGLKPWPPAQQTGALLTEITRGRSNLLLTHLRKHACRQQKPWQVFLSLAFLWIWTQVKCANMPIVINGIANVLVTSDLLSQQYPAWWCQRLYGGSIYSVTRMFHNYSCLVSYLISKL